MTKTPNHASFPSAPAVVSEVASPFYLRLLLMILLLCLAGAVGYVFFATPLGHQLRDRKIVHGWVADHRTIAPLILISVYILFGSTMMPVWWIQLSAGYCFGLWWGLLWCEIGAVIAAVLSLTISRWMLGEWFHRRYENRMVKLRKFDEALGHNGLLVVMTVRLAHVLPFCISNYLFGITTITTIDVAIGTLFGGSIAISFYVALGVGRHVLSDWRYWTIASILNLVLLVPLILRYLFPAWFKKIGIE